MRASDRAYSSLRDDIMVGALSPGSVLAEVELSGRLGVSRTPVREALSRLTADGLAVQAPGRGTVVTSISLDDVDLLFELRVPLETQAAGLAARRGESRIFHQQAERFEEVGEGGLEAFTGERAHQYYRLTGELDATIDDAVANPYLTSALRALRVHLVRIRRLAKDSPSRLADSAREHRDICRAIAAQDAPLAEAATQVHLRRSLAYIRGSAEQHTTEPSRKDTIEP